MTIQQLNRRLAHWQRKLGLSDWKISIAIRRRRDMMRDDEVLDGWVWWWPEESPPRAEIRIRHGIADQEGTLIHEMLHLRLQGHEQVDKRPYDELYERGLNAISAALIEKKP